MKPVLLNELEIMPTLDYTIEYNGQTIQVKRYISTAEKLELISNILRRVGANPYPFANPVQIEVYLALEIVSHYTSIDIGDALDSDPGVAYDKLYQSGLLSNIMNSIVSSEYNMVRDGVEKTLNAYYSYRNSIKGILEDVTTDYKNLDLDATAIQEKLADGENVTFLKEVLEKLG